MAFLQLSAREAGSELLKVLIVGGGAREHALAWKTAQSRHCPELLIAPGNAGTADLGRNIEIDAEDIDGLLELALREAVDLTIVGPEGPLAAGLVDRFNACSLPVFGPTKAAARIESSKAFAKMVMTEAGVPTSRADVYTDLESAILHIETSDPPFVVKADGLAAGKGVLIAQDRESAREALHSMFVDRAFGSAGNTVLVEEWMEGREVSVFAFLDGEYVSELTVACDYKRVYDNDIGPNTGGMGSYSPPPFWDAELEESVRTRILLPVAKEMADMGCPFRGILYGGIMLTDQGPRVFEFNCRMGDPEAQVVLPRLKSDLLDVVFAAINGHLSECSVEWSPDPWVGIVMASEGYPAAYETGVDVSRLPSNTNDSVIFHAGTRIHDGSTVTSGGRVLTATARGSDIADARRRAYKVANEVEFANAYFRTDIAASI